MLSHTCKSKVTINRGSPQSEPCMVDTQSVAGMVIGFKLLSRVFRKTMRGINIQLIFSLQRSILAEVFVR